MATTIGDLRSIITADATQYNKEVDSAQRKITNFAKTSVNKINQIGKGFTSLGRQMTLGVTAPLVLLAKNFDNAGLEMARMQKRLEFATGSAEGATEAFNFINTEVDRLGTNLAASIDGFSKFAAAARGTTLEGQGVKDVFLGINAAAATLGLSADQTSGAITALEQIMSKGKVQAEELRGQLGERIPGAFQIAARAMGVTTAALNKMLDNGELVSDVFLPKFAAELQKTFVGGASAAVKASNNLSNSFFRLKNSFAGSGLQALFAKFKDSLAGMLDTIQKLSPETQRLGIVIAGALAVAGPLLIVIGKTLSVVFTPFGLLVTALGVVAYNFVQLSNLLNSEGKDMSDSTRQNVELMGKSWLRLLKVFHLVSVGFKTIVQGIYAGMTGLIQIITFAAEMTGMEKLAADGRKQIAQGKEIVASFENSKVASFEALQEIENQWNNAPAVLKKDVNALIGVFKELPAGMMDMLKSSFPGLSEEMTTLFNKLQGFIKNGLPALEVPVVLAPQGPTPTGGDNGDAAAKAAFELAATKATIQSSLAPPVANISDWESYTNTLTGFARTIADAFGSAIDTMVSGMVNALVAGQSVGLALEASLISAMASTSSQLLAMAMKNAIASIAINQAQVVGNAAASAPTPFAIPFMVGIGLAALAAGLSSVGFGQSSSGGGSGSSMAKAAPSASTSSSTDALEVNGPDSREAQRIIIEAKMTDEQGNSLFSWLVDAADNTSVGNRTIPVVSA
jgi:tape measure domain-containing protein